MTKRAVWLIAALAVIAAAIVVLVGAQSSVSRDPTIQDLMDLLLTEDGTSRLTLIEEMLEDIDHEVDIIHGVAEQMLDEQYGFFDKQGWSLTDLKHQLNLIEAKLDGIKAKTDCLTCH